MERLALMPPGPVWLRHIKIGTAADPGAVEVLGAYLAPQDVQALNGEQGFRSGSYEGRLYDSGGFSVLFPNEPGSDGVRHSDRFRLLNEDTYRFGTEFVEVWRGLPGRPSDPLYVGVPVPWTRTSRDSAVELAGGDPLILLRKARELQSGFQWRHAPRELFEHYTQVWRFELYDEFVSDSFAWGTGEATSGGWLVRRAEQFIGASDAFTDPDGTLLTAHTAGGVTWTRHPAAIYTGDETIASGRVYATAVTAAYASVVPPSAEYDVEADVYCASVIAQNGVTGRGDTTADTMYFASRTTTGWSLAKRVAGTPTVLGTYTETPVVGETKRIKLEIRNATKKLYVDGVERISSADNAITAAGRAGVRGTGGTATTGFHIDNWSVSSPDTGGGPRVYINATGGYPLDGYVRSVEGFPVGTLCSEPYTGWRAAGTVEALDNAGNGPFTVSTDLFMGLDDGAGADHIGIRCAHTNVVPGGMYWTLQSGPVTKEILGPGQTARGETTLGKFPQTLNWSIEARERYVWFYINGVLLGVLPLPASDVTARPQVRVLYNSGTTESGPGVRVHTLGFRRTRPFLMRGPDKGDLMLPLSLTAGGLAGEWFDNQTTDDEGLSTAGLRELAFSPSLTPYYHRVDNLFLGLGPVYPWPAAPPDLAAHMPSSARWTGSIYLDLARYDYNFRQTTTRGMRTYIGHTRFGEQILDKWDGSASSTQQTQTGGMRALLGQVSGWYPIVIEGLGHNGGVQSGPPPYLQGSSPSVGLEYARSDTPATWQPVGGTQDGSPLLSPQGCFVGEIKGDSHYEVLRMLGETFALQFVCEPRSLESGEFPGQVIPRVRVGRDTEKVLDRFEATDVAERGTAEDVCDTLTIDAGGLGENLTVEGVNPDTVMAGLFANQEQESFPEITLEQLARTRLTTLMALRSAPWSEVAAQPNGHRELIDSFPLTGQLALFDWGPGDGVRLDLANISVKDTSPRQILGVTRPFTPAGLRPPAVSFAQRPRGFIEVLKKLGRQFYASQRYQ